MFSHNSNPPWFLGLFHPRSRLSSQSFLPPFSSPSSLLRSATKVSLFFVFPSRHSCLPLLSSSLRSFFHSPEFITSALLAFSVRAFETLEVTLTRSRTAVDCSRYRSRELLLKESIRRAIEDQSFRTAGAYRGTRTRYDPKVIQDRG